MEHLFRGEVIEGQLKEHYLRQLKVYLEQELLLEPLPQEVVIEAVHTLITAMDIEALMEELVGQGMSQWKAKILIDTMLKLFTRDALWKKIDRELGDALYEWKIISDGIEEKYQPYGVMMHIGAGNVVALSVMSIIEGLLTGNINILKLPSYEGGISIKLLKALVEIEPLLKPYIYVFDIPSKDTKTLTEIAGLVDGVIVWGSDEAIGGIRQLAPPHLPLIEWGHRMSFAYFTAHDESEKDITGLANEICISDQQYCNSPQCVFYETEDKQALEDFGEALLQALIVANEQYPPKELDLREQAEITWTRQLVKMEAILGEKKLFIDESQEVSIMMAYKPMLKPLPLNRNIWLMPIKRQELIHVLREQHGHLQTAFLSCSKTERDTLSQILYRAGVTRITTCGAMSETYAGEPHDGAYTLRKYVKRVSRRGIE